MMKIRYNVRSLVLLLLILLWGMYACENGNGEQPLKPSKDVKADQSNSSAQIADLLAAMNMYHFSEPFSAPEFTLTSVTGDQVSLSSYRGKVVMLSFWATW
jgi:hypothetical protein